MDRYFICLANSYKRGGRCLAGIEITYSPEGKWEIARNGNGSPHWIRPIADTQFGEIPNYCANCIKLLSVIKLTGVKDCPKCVHSEDVHYLQMEALPLAYPPEQNVLTQLVDNVHQSIFGNRGKAVSAATGIGTTYSLMMIHAENVQAYVDENREKSKNRMKFDYFGTEYDFPITDPAFLDEFRKVPEHFANIPDVYLIISLGLEFEGWHHKLIAGVIIPTDYEKVPTVSSQAILSRTSKLGIEDETVNTQHKESSWFEEYERELTRLLDQKELLEEQINELRQKLLKKMENSGVSKVCSSHFTISYNPAKTVMQFDSRAFKAENEELYSIYCKPKQREASIIVKRIKDSE